MPRSGLGDPIGVSDASPLPGDVELLLRRRLRSLTQLDTLLLVRSGPQTSTDVARALRISESHAEEELGELVALRLAAVDGSVYSYAASPRARATIDALAELYPTYRVAIAQAIFSTQDGQTRSFSDASRLRITDQN